jgi:SAM-dependent methyltransferase
MVTTRKFDPVAFARQLRTSCGFGNYLYQGSDPVGVVSALRRELLDARSGDADRDEPVHAVILDFRHDAAETLSRLGEVAGGQARYLIVLIEFAGAHDVASREREAFERALFSSGYRKIFAYYDFNPFEALNEGAGLHIAPFERVPPDALDRYNLEVLEKERLLHTDMAREAGRRSDAHCVRYRQAAEYIRPGDRVLDVACGLGYGSRIMFEASAARTVRGFDLSDFGIDYANAHYGVDGRVDFAVGDAEKLDGVPDASVDFIAAFETIEHVPHPEAYLQQLKRVLKPGGRVMICAPNDWTDETGRDPNPHHLHVYDWKRLKGEVEGHFLIEKAFIQVAGGAMKCHFSPRSWTEVDPEQPQYSEAEWVIFLGMKDPLEPGTARFEESSWVIPESSRFNVSAFARDYLNPWVVKAMVAIGMRVQNANLLALFRRRVLETTPSGSPDHGAALCGTLYGLIERSDFDGLDAIRAKVDECLANNRPAPHQRRWQVSIAYAMGLAEYLGGDPRTAIYYLNACINIDPVPFSPILGNKTLDALYAKAVILITNGDILGAQALLRKSILLPKHWTSSSIYNAWHRSWMNVIGRSDAPLPFGLAEMGVLFDKAARAAYLLSMLDTAVLRPGAFAREAEGFLERQIGGLRHELFKQQEAIRMKTDEILVLNRNVSDLVAHSRALSAQIAEREQRIDELMCEVTAQSESAQSLAREVMERERKAQEFAQQIRDLDAHAQGLAQQIRELDAHSQILAEKMSVEIDLRDREIDKLKGKIAGTS